LLVDRLSLLTLAFSCDGQPDGQRRWNKKATGTFRLDGGELA
jgi:hypothetical protein